MNRFQPCETGETNVRQLTPRMSTVLGVQAMKNHWEEWFKQVTQDTHFGAAYPHQLKVAESLEQGKSILLRAPTGSGKTEAVLVPFLKLRGSRMPSRTVYSLPLRALVEDIGDRTKKYAQNAGLSLSVHHGAHIDDPMFRGDIILTTIDQTIAAYVCTPLSFALKHGTICAGAVATSFLVFDEIQLLDPQLGLQACLILADHSSKVGFPFIIMSATLPSRFLEKFADEHPEIEIIDDVRDEEIPSRVSRKVKLFWKNKLLDAKEIEKAYLECSNRIIVICNTVRKAQQLFTDLEISEKLLVHSRFLEQDRKDVEKTAKRIFGRDGHEPGILITTQVIEAGMDISSHLVLTELAPIDSLIQRAGRCARWGGEGKLLVYKPESGRPYTSELLQNTEHALQEYDEAILTWDLEKTLIDEMLNPTVDKQWLNPETKASIIFQLSEAAFTGEREQATRAIRDEFSCEISLHQNPELLGNDIIHLERVRVPFWIFKNWAENHQLTVWEVAEENLIDDDMEIRWRPSQINDLQSILPFKHYVVSAGEMGYNKQVGLAQSGDKQDFPLGEPRTPTQLEGVPYQEETWTLHAKRTAAEAERLLDSYPFEISVISTAFEVSRDAFKKLIVDVAKLHDLGKLNQEWQLKAGWNGETPLAHSGNEQAKFPPHATVSANALSTWAYKNYKTRKLHEAIILAIAHHHSLRSSYFPPYQLIEGWDEVLKDSGVDPSIIATIIPGANRFHLPAKFPEFSNPFLYRAYVFISRVLKFADWVATGGNNAILRFENRYVNV